ncbi:MAG: hypothetical protein QOG95_433 [Mycobacterium sp.]|jgi:hypothetical protein|nr:hypothetical protein [Mycobacterium sp.]
MNSNTQKLSTRIVDIVILARTYYTVCGLLNAFEVSAPSETPS